MIKEQYLSQDWKTACQNIKIDIKHTGTESYNSLGNGKTYHSFLRRIYNKAKNEHREIENELVLQIKIKVINDTAGPEGLVPTLLVFGVLFRTLE